MCEVQYFVNKHISPTAASVLQTCGRVQSPEEQQNGAALDSVCQERDEKKAKEKIPMWGDEERGERRRVAPGVDRWEEAALRGREKRERRGKCE